MRPLKAGEDFCLSVLSTDLTLPLSLSLSLSLELSLYRAATPAIYLSTHLLGISLYHDVYLSIFLSIFVYQVSARVSACLYKHLHVPPPLLCLGSYTYLHLVYVSFSFSLSTSLRTKRCPDDVKTDMSRSARDGLLSLYPWLSLPLCLSLCLLGESSSFLARTSVPRDKFPPERRFPAFWRKSSLSTHTALFFSMLFSSSFSLFSHFLIQMVTLVRKKNGHRGYF